MKNCDRDLENAARVGRPRAGLSRPRSRLSLCGPVNNLFTFSSLSNNFAFIIVDLFHTHIACVLPWSEITKSGPR